MRVKDASRIAAAALLCLALLGAGRAQAADKIRVGVLKPNVVTVIYWIAVKTGAFEKNGIEVEEKPFPSGQSVAGVEQLLRGNLDVYMGAGGEAVRANSQSIVAGKPAPIAVIQGTDIGGTSILMRPEFEGKTLDQLKDQPLKIGISSPSSIHLINFRGYLAERHLTTEQMKWQLVSLEGGNMVPALLSKQLDGFMHDALTATLAVNAKAGFVFMNSHRGDMGEKAKTLPNTLISASRAFLKAHPDTAKRFVQALLDASKSYETEPKAKTAEIMADWTHSDPAVLASLQDRFDARVLLTRQSADAWWEFNGATLKARGEIDEKVRFDDIFDLSYASPGK
jgi:NitT/TauT family transport system substrate-binding protein